VSLFDNITKRTRAALRKLASPEPSAKLQKVAEPRKGADTLASTDAKAVEKRYRIFQFGEFREVTREEYLRYIEQANERTWHRIW
jgi:hypothetical protein